MDKMNRVGILTLPIGMNVGGTLQAFALNKTLRDMGYKVETINNKLNSAEIGRVMRTYRKFTTLFQSLFIKKYITLGQQTICTHHDFLKIKDHYDAFIVGSDQVWRKGCTDGCLYDYFLEFVGNDSKKIAYAASFGISDWEYSEEERKKIYELLDSFIAVSVREASGVKLCDKYLKKKAIHVLDPTLLQPREVYENLCKKVSQKNFLFAYILDENKDKEKIIESYSRTNGLNVFAYRERKRIKNLFLLRDLDLLHYMYPSIRAWLTKFVEANFVVTDSFHGIVFSIIFNKQFIAIANPGRGITRMESLLNTFNLTDRLVYCYNDYSNRIWNRIDFTLVNEILQNEREKSLYFLDKALK